MDEQVQLVQTSPAIVNSPFQFNSISIDHFQGAVSKVSTKNWFYRYEMLASRNKWSDSDRVFMLGHFLKEEANEWYISTVRKNEGLVFEEMKELLLQRFDIKLVKPLVEFFRLRYDPMKGIRNYFEKKRELGINAQLTEKQIVILMIDGLSPALASFFTTVKPQGMDEFFNIARQAESNLKLTEVVKVHSTHIDRRAYPQKRKLPPSPCRICENKGLPGGTHWANECRNRESTFKKPRPTVAFTRTVPTKNLN